MLSIYANIVSCLVFRWLSLFLVFVCVSLKIPAEHVEDGGHVSFGAFLGAILQSDRPDGLIPTLVVCGVTTSLLLLLPLPFQIDLDFCVYLSREHNMKKFIETLLGSFAAKS